MTTGRRETQKAKTRNAIFEAAMRLFSHKGYEQTSIQDIARAAGIGKSTVYTYFEAKEDIFLAFCESEIEFSFGSLGEQVDPDAPLVDELHRLFMQQFRFVIQNREFGRIYVREMAFPKKVSSRKLASEEPYLNFLNEIVTRAKERGEIAPEHDNFFLSVHFYMLYLGTLSGYYSGYVTTLEDVAKGLRILLEQAVRGVSP